MNPTTTDIRLDMNTGNLMETVAHLYACSPTIIPPLHEKVDIQAYGEKMLRLAHRFEAWDGAVLIGLVAAYLNDPSRQKGYITHVSVLPAYAGRGTGNALLSRCITLGRSSGFDALELEVNIGNHAAVLLYEKFGFEIRDHYGDMVRMHLIL